MEIQIIKEPITRTEAKEIAKEFYEDMVKGAVDLEREIIALGGEYHIDANMVLIEDGSKQENIWGFNLYPDKGSDDRIQYKALINIRPALGNNQMEIGSEDLKTNMKKIIERLIQ